MGRYKPEREDIKTERLSKDAYQLKSLLPDGEAVIVILLMMMEFEYDAQCHEKSTI